MARRSTRIRSSRRAVRLDFGALESIGGLLTPDIIARIAAFEAQGQDDESYRVPPGLKVRDEIARYFRIGEAMWTKFAAARTASPAASEKFALDLNIAAAQEAARQLRLRNLAGLIAIDFVSLRARSHTKQLEDAVRAAFADDPWSVQFGGLSRFGVFDLARSQLRTPLHEQLRDPDGRLSVETVALMALRAVEREARAQTGRQIACTVSPEVKAWLDAGEIDWRSELSNRIGMRWTIDAAPGARDKIDARAL